MFYCEQYNNKSYKEEICQIRAVQCKNIGDYRNAVIWYKKCGLNNLINSLLAELLLESLENYDVTNISNVLLELEDEDNITNLKLSGLYNDVIQTYNKIKSGDSGDILISKLSESICRIMELNDCPMKLNVILIKLVVWIIRYNKDIFTPKQYECIIQKMNEINFTTKQDELQIKNEILTAYSFVLIKN